MDKALSITQAVRNTLEAWPEGEEQVAYHVCNEVRRRIRMDGQDKRPMETTIMRRLHENAEEFGIVCDHHRDKSKYRKLTKEEKTERIRQIIREGRGA
jgi:hypothetical protein